MRFLQPTPTADLGCKAVILRWAARTYYRCWHRRHSLDKRAPIFTSGRFIVVCGRNALPVALRHMLPGNDDTICITIFLIARLPITSFSALLRLAPTACRWSRGAELVSLSAMRSISWRATLHSVVTLPVCIIALTVFAACS